MSYETARKFWSCKTTYPNYPNTKKRRLIDVNFITNYTDNAKSVLDLGCADGYLLIMLREFTEIKTFYGYDISEDMLALLINRWGTVNNDLFTKVCDFSKSQEFPKTDVTLSMGMFPYIFKKEDLYNILVNIKSDVFIVRAPCSTSEEDIYINKYSEELGNNYSSIYRTVENYKNILSRLFTNVAVERAYPEEIESSYGTKHYYFVCKSRKNF